MFAFRIHLNQMIHGWSWQRCMHVLSQYTQIFYWAPHRSQRRLWLFLGKLFCSRAKWHCQYGVCVYKIFKARCVSIAKIMIETGNGAFSCTLHCDETLWMNWQVDGGMAWWWCCFALLWSTPNLYTQIKENKCNYSANSKLNNIHEHNTHIQTHRLFSRSFSLKTVREFDKERIVRTSGTNCTKCSNVKM